jgi:hypothetical protein
MVGLWFFSFFKMTDATMLRNSEVLCTVPNTRSPLAYQQLRTKQMLDIIITQSTLRQVHSLFQSEFLVECKLVLLFQFPVSSLFLVVI